jgi:hypothetical protein
MGFRAARTTARREHESQKRSPSPLLIAGQHESPVNGPRPAVVDLYGASKQAGVDERAHSSPRLINRARCRCLLSSTCPIDASSAAPNTQRSL